MDIRALCERFRKAICQCPAGELPITFRDFPAGSCDDASLVLGRYLEENGITGLVICRGEREYWVDDEPQFDSHAWLEKDGLIIDITVSQFNDPETDVASPLPDILITMDRTFYNRYVKTKCYPFDFKRENEQAHGSLGWAYWQINKQLNSQP